MRDRYVWSVRHVHGSGEQPCRDVVRICREGSRGALVVAFRGVSEHGYLMKPDGGLINVHEPGTARRVLDAALREGWEPSSLTVVEKDGWALLTDES